MVNLHTSPATGFQVSYAQGRQQTSLIISTFEKKYYRNKDVGGCTNIFQDSL